MPRMMPRHHTLDHSRTTRLLRDARAPIGMAEDAVEAAAAAVPHLASSSTTADAQAVVNGHSDTFTRALKVCAIVQMWRAPFASH